MARTALTVQAVVDSGLEEVPVAANVDGNWVPGDGDTVLHVINADAADITVTVITGGTFHGQAVADEAIVVTAGEERFIGRFKPALYNDPSTGFVNIDYSAVTNITVAALGI